jgi:GNAT superfamily N-acetyltransferase
LENQRVGLIGHYAAADDGAAAALLAHACRQLRSEGCTLAVGPMDGSTWRDYRFVTEYGERPQFWLEPYNPPAWPQQFARGGFKPLARYFSALNSNLDYRDRRLERVADRLKAAGVRLRPVGEDTFDGDLRRIFAVARTAFHGNLLYSDLHQRDFLQQFAPLHKLAPLELSWLAEHQDRTVGFLFAVPDLREEAREGQTGTVIIKTLAVLPGRAYAGLGQWLLAHVQQRAREAGYSRAIHALVRDVGALRRISARYARVMRRYTLFAKVLN